MSCSPDTDALTPAERAVLRRARAEFARGSAGLLLAGVLAVAAASAGLAAVADPGAMLLATSVALWWVALLGRMPRRWKAAGRDLAAGRVESLSGIPGVRVRRGIGLLAPTRYRLLLAGRDFVLQPAQAAALREGVPARVRFAPASGVLLDVEQPLPPTATTPAAVGGAPGVEPEAHGLTAREAELLRLIAEGHADKLIARRLGLEPATVRTYSSQLYAKLGVRGRTEAVARARALGLRLDPPA